MNDDQYEDDIDDDLEDDDVFENGILKDGRSLRCPVQFMDAQNMAALKTKFPARDAVADMSNPHRPGWRTPTAVSDQDRIIADSYASYIDHLRGGAKPPKRPVSLADSQAAAQQAYLEYVKFLTDAYKQGRQP